ncbi:MAG: SRPBCC domain-containing protein [Cyclobacteriaceae bacterium]|nr:SRPBCC domain-containing protein [Cyclobacteriaceae bacterium]
MEKGKVLAVDSLLITRIFDAPIDLVWKAWTEPKHFMEWWGPKNFSSPACRMDFRIGGKYHFCMRSPEGQDFWTTGVYREIVPLKKIVWTDCFADEKGNVVPASVYGMAGLPDEMVVTITFEDLGGKTKFMLVHEGLPEGQMKEMTSSGWNESFDKLATSVRS